MTLKCLFHSRQVFVLGLIVKRYFLQTNKNLKAHETEHIQRTLLRKEKRNKGKDKQHPIMVRITIDSEQVQFNSQLMVDEEDVEGRWRSRS